MSTLELFEAKYEQGYLRRELGEVVTQPDVAITELVANAYDAGASKVSIIIPDDYNSVLSIEDDGVGMTESHIHNRWFKLRYNRLEHQGPNVAFPSERAEIKRKAFGRNGIGRHGLFCFGDSYNLETWCDGVCNSLHVGIGDSSPIKVLSRGESKKEGHGTRLTTVVSQNLWSGERVSEMLASRFISMPDFSISVNGKNIEIGDHPAVIDVADLVVGDVKLKITILDSKEANRVFRFRGLGIWVGGRRVGEMEWRLGNRSFVDGRKSFSLRFAVIVQTEDLRDEILEDWSGFKAKSQVVESVSEALQKYINQRRRDLLKDEIAEVKSAALSSNFKEYSELPQLAKEEISNFVDLILEENPELDFKILQLAVRAAINLEKSHLGQNLLTKLVSISSDDIEALDQLLDDWSARDALKALSEIDGRLKVIETLRRLSGDKNADELHTIHPLLLKARWLFGPEYESSEFSSNVGLVKTIEQVFGKRIDPAAFINSKKRPDIVVLKDACVGAQALEDFDEDGIVVVKKVLLIEVKRGGFPIGRDEMNQTDGYVQDIAYSDILGSMPYVSAFVVGETIESKTAKSKKIKDSDDKNFIGEVRAVTFSNLISTAEHRLFRLRNKLSERYSSFTVDELVQETLTENLSFSGI